MRLKTVPVKVKPKEGDTMTEKHFAWWPKKVEDKLIWLEYYNVHSKFVVRERVHDLFKYGLVKVTGGGWDVISEQLIQKA